jgi:miniconductance mechanosensitive channel
VSDSFQNWRGMEESGGRRIKRSIFIDINTIKFCNQEMLDRFSKIHLIKDYIKETEEKLNKINEENGGEDSVEANSQRQTNIGIFRAYMNAYLQSNTNLHDHMTFVVRQLQLTEKGLPLEIYVFSKVKEWAAYEALQADIFDHILSVVSEFDLSIFQNPSGNDFKEKFKLN